MIKNREKGEKRGGENVPEAYDSVQVKFKSTLLKREVTIVS
jgi:hypothetical protein